MGFGLAALARLDLAKHVDMTAPILEGSLPRNVFRLGAPLALGMALQTAFNLVDAYLIAQLAPGEREAAIGAVGVCDQVAAVGSIVSYGISTATATLVAKAKGAGDDEAVRRLVWQSFLVILALSILFGLGALAVPAFITYGMGLHGQVAALSIRYLRVMLAGSFTVFFLLHAASIQRALGSAKTGVFLLALGNVLNVAFAIAALFGPEGARDWALPGAPPVAALAWGASLARAVSLPAMGMQGAAWATLLARALVLVPMVLVLGYRFKALDARRLRPDFSVHRQILALAWPSSVQFVVRIGLGLFVNALIARTFTSETNQTASTAMGLVFRVDTLALFAAVGWGTAAQTFAGQNLGAQKPARAFAAGLWASLYALLCACLLWLALSHYSAPVLRFFGKEEAAVQLGVHYLQIASIGYLPLTVCIVLGGAIVGAEGAKLTLAMDLSILLLAQVPLCLWAVSGPSPQIAHVFYAALLASSLAACAYAALYLSRRWLRTDVVLTRH